MDDNPNLYPSAFGRHLVPPEAALAGLAQLTADLARKQITLGKPASLSELDKEYSRLLDQLVRAGVCQETDVPPTIGKEFWLQMYARRIETLAAGHEIEDEATPSLSSPAQTGLLPLPCLPVAAEPFRPGPELLQLLLSRSGPGQERVVLPFQLRRSDGTEEIAFIAALSDPLSLDLFRQSVAVSFWEEIEEIQDQVSLGFFVRLYAEAENALVLGASVIKSPHSLPAFQLLAQQTELSYFLFPLGQYEQALVEKRFPWPESSRQRVISLLADAQPGFGAAARADAKPAGKRQYYWGGQAGESKPTICLVLDHGLRLADITTAFMFQPDWLPVPAGHVDPHLGPGKWKGICALVVPEGEDPEATQPRDFFLSFYWPREWDPITALRSAVEEAAALGTMPPWPLVGGLFAALQCYQADSDSAVWRAACRWLLTPAVAFRFAPVPLLPRKQVEELAAQWDGNTLDFQPFNPFSCAQFLWEVGKLCWTPWIFVRKPRIVPDHFQEEADAFLSLAYAYKIAQPRPLKAPLPNLGGIQSENDSLYTVRRLWNTFRYLGTMHQAGIAFSPQVLEFILPGKQIRAVTEDYPIEIPPALQEGRLPAANEPDPDTLYVWAQELERSAVEQQAYVAIGNFRVPIPEDMPLLRSWGVEELRLVADPQGFWVGVVTPKRSVAVIFRWPAGEKNEATFAHLMPLLPEWARALFNLLCAALWRDLRTAGPRVFPAVADQSRRHQAPRSKQKSGAAPASAAPLATVRTLPRHPATRRMEPWHLHGEKRAWGTDEERREIGRRATIVSGHLRAWLYHSECALCPLLAASATPPMDAWRRRLRTARRQQDTEQESWWETMLSAAGASQQERGEAGRLRQVESIVAAAAHKHAASQRLGRWLKIASGAIEDAKNNGLDQVIEPLTRLLKQQREDAAHRAEKWGAPPPPEGYTFVQPFTTAGRSDQEQPAAPTVRAKGLQVVRLVLETGLNPVQTVPDIDDEPQEIEP